MALFLEAMETSEFHELIPGLPEDIGLECLIRLPYITHIVASQVCRRWRALIESQELYHHRRRTGLTHKMACLVQAIPRTSNSPKPSDSLRYGITVFDSISGTWERLDPVPKHPDGLPLFCRLASSDDQLVVMGGWDPINYDPVTDVFVYDFKMGQWRQGKSMPTKCSFFGIGAYEGRVYIAGGHDENKNALTSAWVYDLRSDEWNELTGMSQERDECEGLVVGDEFWVVSGYGTESQGGFEGSADVYGFGSGQWRRIEGVWEPGKCPRGCVGGIGRDGTLVSWDEGGVMVLGTRALVTGTVYQGGPQGLYMVELNSNLKSKEGQKGKSHRISVPEEFCGSVQSGCCIEI